MTRDLIVVGAGPAGLAAAIDAAVRGLRVVIIEKRQPPLDKPCGEGIMPAGVSLLSELGVRPTAARSRRFPGVRFVDGDIVAEARFPNGPGLAVRRLALSQAMIHRALSTGVELRFGCALLGFEQTASTVVAQTAEGELHGRWLVGADGLHSRVRRSAGLELPVCGRRRFGMRRHFAIPPWTQFVEVHWTDGAEAYVTPVSDQEVGVALLWSGDGSHFDELLARFPTLARRLDRAPASSEIAGAGPFRQRARRRYRGRVALIGDAAGYLDAITGEGVTLGLRSAKELVHTICAGLPLHRYERAYRRLAFDVYHFTRIQLALAAHPRLRHRVMNRLAEQTELFERLLAIGAGERPLNSLGVGGALQLVSAASSH